MDEMISVIVPVFNVEQYLEKCVNSIVNQTYRNLEIILVDDGSTDNSGSICDQIAMRDSRIRVIHKTNGGLSDARNTGIDVAKGTCYSFIDSDDFITPDTIAKMYAAISASNSDIAVCNIVRIFEDDTTEYFYRPVTDMRLLEGNERFETLKQPSVCNKLFKAELFKGVCFPKGKYYEDTYVYHILAYRANKIVLTGHDGYWYLSRKSSILGQPKYTSRYFDFIEAVYLRTQFLLEHQVQPYGNEACLSLYAAYANACHYIDKEENQELFHRAKVQYKLAYDQLMKMNAKIGCKQKLRLVLLYFAPNVHGKLYGKKV